VFAPQPGNQSGERMLRANLQTKCGTNRPWNQERIADACKIDQPNAVIIGFDALLGHGEGEGRLADPTWSSDGEQTRLRQPIRKLVDNIGPSDQRRQDVDVVSLPREIVGAIPMRASS